MLAATLSPSYGIYSGFELCENAAVEGREEYLDSEKYEIKPRDWNCPGNIKDVVARVNRARRETPSLQQLTNLRFLEVDNAQIIGYVKGAPAGGGDAAIVVVNLDASTAHEATVRVPADAIGVPAGDSYTVHDLLTGSRYRWAERNHVRLDPAAGEPAHIFRVERGG